jgi:hypothetical protein
MQAPRPVIDFALHVIFGLAVSLLDLAFQLLTVTVDLIDLVIGKLAPLLLGVAFELLPVSLKALPVHRGSSIRLDGNGRNGGRFRGRRT